MAGTLKLPDLKAFNGTPAIATYTGSATGSRRAGSATVEGLIDKSPHSTEDWVRVYSLRDGFEFAAIGGSGQDRDRSRDGTFRRGASAFASSWSGLRPGLRVKHGDMLTTPHLVSR